jgi:hypothetical protein
MNSHSVANGSLSTWTWTLGVMFTYAVVVHAVVTHDFVCKCLIPSMWLADFSQNSQISATM